LDSGIVTFIVTHKVKPHLAAEFESVNRALNRIVESAEGYLGINVIKTVTEVMHEYTVILRFNSYRNLKNWAESPTRVEYVDQLRSLSDQTSEALETGLEYWFTTPGSVSGVSDDVSDARTVPPRYKMAIVTILVIFPLVIGVPALVGYVLEDVGLSFILEVLVSVVLITVAMTYFAMPSITKLFSFWLYPGKLPRDK